MYITVVVLVLEVVVVALEVVTETLVLHQPQGLAAAVQEQ
jgi:hypothetical protein